MSRGWGAGAFRGGACRGRGLWGGACRGVACSVRGLPGAGPRAGRGLWGRGHGRGGARAAGTLQKVYFIMWTW